MMHARKTLIAALFLAFAASGFHPVVGQEGHKLSINGTQIYYEVRGDGPPLLLLHYFGNCGQAWQPFMERLARHYRLIIPDMRGHGRSTNPSGQFTHRQSALDMFALLDQLGIQRCKAMGMSSGGMTLIHMATQQPERFEAMVLIGATTHFPAQARAIMRRSIPDSLTSAEREEWGQCSARGEAQTREVLGQFHRMKDSYDDMSFTEPYLATITARTLIVHGDRDEIFPVDIPVQMYGAIPRSYLWIVPNGGHIPVFGKSAGLFQDKALAFLQGEWEKS
ncbi:alpha/beta hydrolase [candidate division KSB1 bacterium]|nr:alpha/beta hydrolase [candidate division KSB1 bacterium]